jgi:SAM-dependent methyltransferase
VAHRLQGERLLETACGTGLLTRRLDASLPPAVRITATDLNDAMVAFAKSKAAASRRHRWRTADAAALPFPDRAFDAVACQFGLMFVPDKEAAFREARRVLRRRRDVRLQRLVPHRGEPVRAGRARDDRALLRLEAADLLPAPFGFHDEGTIRGHLARNGFVDVACERVARPAVAPSARDFARGLVEGNPVAHAIRDAGLSFPKIIDAVAAALIAEGGDHPFRSTMHALVVSARAS